MLARARLLKGNVGCEAGMHCAELTALASSSRKEAGDRPKSRLKSTMCPEAGGLQASLKDTDCAQTLHLLPLFSWACNLGTVRMVTPKWFSGPQELGSDLPCPWAYPSWNSELWVYTKKSPDSCSLARRRLGWHWKPKLLHIMFHYTSWLP